MQLVTEANEPKYFGKCYPERSNLSSDLSVEFSSKNNTDLLQFRVQVSQDGNLRSLLPSGLTALLSVFCCTVLWGGVCGIPQEVWCLTWFCHHGSAECKEILMPSLAACTITFCMKRNQIFFLCTLRQRSSLAEEPRCCKRDNVVLLGRRAPATMNCPTFEDYRETFRTFCVHRQIMCSGAQAHQTWQMCFSLCMTSSWNIRPVDCVSSVIIPVHSK